MTNVDFKQVDVFTAVPYLGNPVAVVMDASSLTTEQMQKIANWTNLSETTFLLPPTQPSADYRVRIFTPQSELPFAGHPTLGTAHALLEAGKLAPRNSRIVQECGAGLVPLTIATNQDGGQVLYFDLPSPKLSSVDAAEIEELEAILGQKVLAQHSPQLVDVGPVWLIAQLESADAVLALRPKFEALAAFSQRNKCLGAVVFGPHAKGAHSDMEVRAFAPSVGVNEDPVCGSGNGSVAAFIHATHQVRTFKETYIATQGSVVGRAGRIYAAIGDDGRVRIGGQSVTCVAGSIVV